jgi:LmbE family N-acetylglucosaminyl deacetylase
MTAAARHLLAAALAVALAATPFVATGRPHAGERGIVARYQAIVDLTNPFTVLCVACHPDDEDGATLTVERRRYGARTATLFATSGEGGQNAVGPELYDALGRIRERETREASAIQGSTPYFLRLADFGFSKSGDEAMRAWEAQMGGHEPLLRQFVAAIRQIRPDAIVTNHDTKTGHGQHQATGRLLVEAFEAAGDARRFADAGPAWRPQALYVRAPRDAKEGIAIETEALDPIRGTTYREQAFEALLRHATQGPWRFDVAPRATRYIAVVAPESSGAGVGSPLTRPLALPPTTFSIPDATSLSSAALERRLREAIAGVDGRNRDEAAEALLALQNVEVALRIAPETIVAGAPARADIVVANGGEATVSLVDANLTSRNVAAVEREGALLEVAPGRAGIFSIELATDVLLAPDATLESAPAGFNRASVSARGPEETSIERGSALVEIATPTGSIAVERAADLYVAPPVRVDLPTRESSARGLVTNVSPVALDLRTERGDGAARMPVRRVGPGESIEIVVPAGARVDVRGRPTGSDGEESLYASASRPPPLPGVKVTPSVRVGYVRSYDYTLPDALARLEVDAREIAPATLRDADLSGFDTIVVDNRAYLEHADLARHNRRLLAWVERGGTLVVFYHKAGEYAPTLAPFPIEIGRSRVADERAPVEILAPDHPLFASPNRIDARDFEGWVQERGLYFPETWAREYTPLLSSHDPGEPPLRGGLLVARFGHGHFVYTSYVWYRQLRGNVAGGYRIFANMLSLGHTAGER